MCCVICVYASVCVCGCVGVRARGYVSCALCMQVCVCVFNSYLQNLYSMYAPLSIYRFCSCVVRDGYPPDVSPTPSPAHTLTFYPPVAIVNLLPYDLQFYLIMTDIVKVIARGETLSLYNVNTLYLVPCIIYIYIYHTYYTLLHHILYIHMYSTTHIILYFTTYCTYVLSMLFLYYLVTLNTIHPGTPT